MLEFGTGRVNLRILFMGTSAFAVAPLEALIHRNFQVVAVYTQPDRPAGRGRFLSSSPVKETALRLKLPVVQPTSLKDAEVVAQLIDFHPDVIVVAAYGQILPQPVLDIPKYGCINLHPSLLPRFRGASPVASAILAGDKLTGTSIMLMASGLDTGSLLASEKVAISPQDTTGSLTAKLSRVAARLLPEVLSRWVEGEITPRPQNDAEATYSTLITKKAGEIHWQLSAVEIWRQVRAYQPWPRCYTWWQGRRLEIIEAVPLPGKPTKAAGQVVPLKSKEAAFGVNTGNGVLGIIKVQLGGRKAMAADEFLRGQGQFIGTVLPSG